MSEFMAKPDEMRDIAVCLQKVSRRIDAATAAIRKTSGQIGHNKSLGKLGYDRMVRDVSDTTEEQSKSVAQAANKLETAAGLYDTYERRVIQAPFGSSTSAQASAASSSGNPFWDFIKGDAKLEGAVRDGSLSGEGAFLGIAASGAISGELLGFEASLKPEVAFNLGDADSDAEAYASVKGKLEGHVAKGKAEGDYGLLHGEAEVTAISGAVEGELGASLFENGKFAPAIFAGASAKASALSGKAESRFGSEDTNLHAEAKGDVLVAEAEARGHIGADGVGATVKAGAWTAQGEISGGFEFMGVKVDLGVKGKAGGAGVEAQFGADKNTVEGELGLGLGLGAGVSFKIDFSGVPKAIDNWWDNLIGK